MKTYMHFKLFIMSTIILMQVKESLKVADSRPDEVDFINRPNPSGRTVALGLTQPLTEMSTRNL
jgi:hypothetical protein